MRCGECQRQVEPDPAEMDSRYGADCQDTGYRRFQLCEIVGQQDRFIRLTAIKIIGAVALLADSSPSLAEGDAAAGELAFTATCGACHSTEPGINQIGPSLVS